MEPRNRVTRPVAQRTENVPPNPAPRPQQYNSPAAVTRPRKAPRKKWLFIGTGILVILAVAYGVMSWLHIVGPLAGVKRDKYQVVVITGQSPVQAYFGKISSITNDYILLKDVYYPQQDATDKEKEAAPATFKLVKLGNELHGPDNEMRINRSQVLYWENLRDDGQVVKTIKQGQ